MPKISVIMPVYNGELFLRQSLDSLLAQSFQDWELIVVDDGSKDHTPQILKEYTDGRIRICRQENRGEAGARNTGLRQMRGEYMAFLDADDIYLSTALEDLSSYLDQNPQYDSVFSDGYIVDHENRQLMRLTEIRPGIFTGNILNPVVLSSSVITVPVCTMTRVAKIRELELFFDEQNNLIGTDWDFWIRLAVHAQFGYLDKLTCRYRIHNTNITRTTGSTKRKKDELYRRKKIMNTTWFNDLLISTRELLFLDLLTNTLSGDIENQQQILHTPQFAAISTPKQADLWRMVGIDALKNGGKTEQIRHFFQEAYRLNPADRKTRALLWSMNLGHGVALVLVNVWYGVLGLRKKMMSVRDTRTVRLQKLLGLK